MRILSGKIQSHIILTPRETEPAADTNAMSISLVSIDRLPQSGLNVVVYMYLDSFFIYKSKCYTGGAHQDFIALNIEIDL